MLLLQLLFITSWLESSFMDKISFDFKGRTAIVTGGAQGFGLDITKRLIRSGAVSYTHLTLPTNREV